MISLLLLSWCAHTPIVAHTLHTAHTHTEQTHQGNVSVLPGHAGATRPSTTAILVFCSEQGGSTLQHKLSDLLTASVHKGTIPALLVTWCKLEMPHKMSVGTHTCPVCLAALHKVTLLPALQSPSCGRHRLISNPLQPSRSTQPGHSNESN